MRKLVACHPAARLADAPRRQESGQTKAEYGVLLALVTLAVIGSMTLLSGNISATLSAVAGVFP
jgi:Flp pilus assembly pilin Flp